MRSPDVSRQRRESVRRADEFDAGTPSLTPTSWIVFAVVVIALAAAAIFFISFISGRESRSTAGSYAPSGPEQAADPAAGEPQPAPAMAPAVDVPDDTGADADQASKPPLRASPDQIVAYQERLAQRVAAQRDDAVRGDILDEELVAFLQERTRGLLEGEDGDDLLATLRESNPGYELEAGEVRPELAVNAEYPEDAPLSTVPPALLKAYPPLPEGIEYRFVGCRLVLLNRDARLILDYTEPCIL